MSKQIGASGRGTDGPAPPMTEEERRKSAGASRGLSGSEPRGPTAPGADERDQRRAQREAGGEDREKPEGSHPGGGRHSESERPDSPDSRWGGGR